MSESTNAVNLSSFSSVKTRTRASSRRLRESTISESLYRETRSAAGHHGGRRGTSNSRNRHNCLYDIEVLEEEEYRIKIHYVGYSSQYDEWIRRSELHYKPARRSRTDAEDDRDDSESSLLFSTLGSCVSRN